MLFSHFSSNLDACNEVCATNAMDSVTNTLHSRTQTDFRTATNSQTSHLPEPREDSEGRDQEPSLSSASPSVLHSISQASPTVPAFSDGKKRRRSHLLSPVSLGCKKRFVLVPSSPGCQCVCVWGGDCSRGLFTLAVKNRSQSLCCPWQRTVLPAFQP